MCHVLIIEDEPLVAAMIRDLLEDEGATSFDFAETQQEAVAAARAHPPALITSDVGLREGTGPLAVAAIEARLGPVPVMFITATPEDCAPCGPAALVIAKPFTSAAVARAFHALAPEADPS
jgi:CheY-like chemotaxis protein